MDFRAAAFAIFHLPSSIICLASWLCFLAATTRGATIAMNASDAGGATSFNTGLHWVGGATPTGGNTYQTLNFLLRTPTVNTPVTFAGDSLQVGPAPAGLRIKTIALVTVNNLVVSNNAVV